MGFTTFYHFNYSKEMYHSKFSPALVFGIGIFYTLISKVNNINMEKDKTEKMNVLVVDDDPICTFLAESLLKKHFNLLSVNNGHSALEAVEKENITLF